MRRIALQASLSFIVGFAIASVVWAEDETPAAPLAIGAVVPDFTITDSDGAPFQLYKRSIDKKQVEAAVRKAAEAAGATKNCPLTTSIDTLKGLMEDDELDTMLKAEMLATVGAPYGRIATEESVASVKTLADAIAWITRLDSAPVVIFCWSPRCPTSNKLNDAIHEQLAQVDTRVYALACNYKDDAATYAKGRSMLDFKLRILPDREQKLTDVLGGKRTPHFFVIDKDNKLRYRGALDNDPMGIKDEAERETWLTDAITAINTGKEIVKNETPGPG